MPLAYYYCGMPQQLPRSGPLRCPALVPGAASVARQLAVLLAVLAMALHAVVVQPHVHVPLGALHAGLSASSGTARAEAGPLGGVHQSKCAICETAAGAGGKVLGAAPILPTRNQFEQSAPAALRAAVIGARPSHAWRSRAPPAFLI